MLLHSFFIECNKTAQNMNFSVKYCGYINVSHSDAGLNTADIMQNKRLKLKVNVTRLYFQQNCVENALVHIYVGGQNIDVCNFSVSNYKHITQLCIWN